MHEQDERFVESCRAWDKSQPNVYAYLCDMLRADASLEDIADVVRDVKNHCVIMGVPFDLDAFIASDGYVWLSDISFARYASAPATLSTVARHGIVTRGSDVTWVRRDGRVFATCEAEGYVNFGREIKMGRGEELLSIRLYGDARVCSDSAYYNNDKMPATVPFASVGYPYSSSSVPFASISVFVPNAASPDADNMRTMCADYVKTARWVRNARRGSRLFQRALKTFQLVEANLRRFCEVTTLAMPALPPDLERDIVTKQVKERMRENT